MEQSLVFTPKRKRRTKEEMERHQKRKDKRVVSRKVERSLWFNPEKGTLHEVVQMTFYRKDGTWDHGDKGETDLALRDRSPDNPNYPGNPYERLTQFGLGAKVNPEPLGRVIKGVVVVTHKKKSRPLPVIAWCNYYETYLPKGARVRNIDGNPWNNRKENLELVARKPYQAVTWIAGTRVCLGSYGTKGEAVEACNAARAAVGMSPVKTRNRGCVK